MAFRRAVVLLCPTCTFTLRNLTLRNARRGSGVAVDFVVGDEHTQSAAVLLEGVYRHRLACTPADDTAEVLSNTLRSSVLPNASGKQAFTIETVTRQVNRPPFVPTFSLPCLYTGTGRLACTVWADAGNTTSGTDCCVQSRPVQHDLAVPGCSMHATH